MKVYVSSDMEGTAGVVDWSQCLAPEPEYEYYRGLLQAEVNAAIDGAMSAGATTFLVNDSHSSMQNLRPDALAGNARYLSGRHKPMYMMEGLDPSYDAVFFVSYHGSMASEASALSHTYNPRAIGRVLLNGVKVGESGINALVALGHGVPTPRAGILVDEEFGAGILRDAIENEYVTALSTEKSGTDEFEFEYGADFFRHIDACSGLPQAS